MMKVNIGRGGKNEQHDMDYTYEHYRPARTPGLYKNLYKKKTKERKWIFQLVVSCAILLVIFGLFRINVPFAGYLQDGVKHLLTSETDFLPIFYKIVQLASNIGNLEWPPIDETSQPSKTAITEIPPGTIMLLPVSGNIIRTYGWVIEPGENVQSFHEGIDIAVPVGTEVKASADGNVLEVGESDSLGKYILIEDQTGELTRYANLSEVLVDQGRTVKAADVIGKSGMKSDRRPHLHFEVIVNGRPVDPIDKLGINFVNGSSAGQYKVR